MLVSGPLLLSMSRTIVATVPPCAQLPSSLAVGGRRRPSSIHRLHGRASDARQHLHVIRHAAGVGRGPACPSLVLARHSSTALCQAQNSSQDRSIACSAACATAKALPALAGLQQFLGYAFRNPELLQQACTHTEDRACPSYKELGFIGDAALWCLFADHAFHTFPDSPRTGRWGVYMGQLLSRSSLAATAKQWGLQQYLQLAVQPTQLAAVQDQRLQFTTPTSTISRPRSATLPAPSSAPPAHPVTAAQALRRRAGRRSFWSTDEMGEMFEGLVGALLLDSDWVALQQLLQPWVAASFAKEVAAAPEADREQVGRAVLAAAVAASCSSSQLGVDLVMQQGSPLSPNSRLPSVGAPSSSDNLLSRLLDSWLQWQHAVPAGQLLLPASEVQRQLQAAVAAGLQQYCGGCRLSPAALKRCSRLMLQELCMQPSMEAQRLQYLGHALLRLCLAVYVYKDEQQAAALLRQPTGPMEGYGPGSIEQQEYLVQLQSSSWWPAAWPTRSNSTDSSSRVFSGPPGSRSCDDDSCSTHSSSSSSSTGCASLVQQLNKRCSALGTVRFRCRLALQLGLDPQHWLGPSSTFMTAAWKQQRAAMAHCMELLLALVYLDQGMEALQQASSCLLAATPPIQQQKEWMPTWVNRH